MIQSLIKIPRPQFSLMRSWITPWSGCGKELKMSECTFWMMQSAPGSRRAILIVSESVKSQTHTYISLALCHPRRWWRCSGKEKPKYSLFYVKGILTCRAAREEEVIPVGFDCRFTFNVTTIDKTIIGAVPSHEYRIYKMQRGPFFGPI